MCFSSRCYCRSRAESPRNHGDVTADMGIPLSCHCGLMAVPWRSLATWLRCWRQHCGASETLCRDGGATAVLLRCYCGATAVLLRCYCGATAVLLRCYCGATAVLLRCYCGATAVLLRCYCGATAVLLRCYCGATAVLLRCYCGATAVLLRCYCGATAVLLRCYCGATAVLLRCYCGATAVLLRCYCGATAVLLRCYCGATAVLLRCYCGATAVLLRCYCGATAVQLRCYCGATVVLPQCYCGDTAVLLRCCCGVTVVLLRCYCGGAAAAGWLYDVRVAAIFIMICGFRSYYRFRCKWGRCYCHYCYYILLLFLSLSCAAGTWYNRMHCRIGENQQEDTYSTSGTAEVLNIFKVSAVPPRMFAVLTVVRGATAINDGTTVELRRSWRCHCGWCRTSTQWHRTCGVTGV